MSFHHKLFENNSIIWRKRLGGIKQMCNDICYSTQQFKKNTMKLVQSIIGNLKTKLEEIHCSKRTTILYTL